MAFLQIWNVNIFYFFSQWVHNTQFFDNTINQFYANFFSDLTTSNETPYFFNKVQFTNLSDLIIFKSIYCDFKVLQDKGFCGRG